MESKTIAHSPAFLHSLPMIFRAVSLIVTVVLLRADGPADNLPDKVRPIPPRGGEISTEARNELTKGLDEFHEQIVSLARNTNKARLLPDVQIFFNAVDYAIRYDEF